MDLSLSYYQLEFSLDCKVCFDNLMFALLNDGNLVQSTLRLYWHFKNEIYNVLIETTSEKSEIEQLIHKAQHKYNIVPLNGAGNIIKGIQILAEEEFKKIKGEYTVYTKSLL